MFSMFGTAQPQMMVFVLERKAFLREYLLGAYSVVSYFFAKVKSWYFNLKKLDGYCVVSY